MSVRMAPSRAWGIVLAAGAACVLSGARPQEGAGEPRATAPASGVEATAMRSFAEFRPSQHGFRFRNAFSGSPLPKELNGLGLSLLAPSRYGLCGGMSFCAADYFAARRPIPSAEAIPAHGSALYERLYARQVESFDGMSAPLMFADWMARPDDGPLGTRRLTLGTLPGIVAELELGRPVILGLVLTSAAKHEPLWENHQVLAYAARTRAGRGGAGAVTELRVYDPNHPGNDEVVVRCVPRVVGMAATPGAVTTAAPVLGLACTLVAPQGDRPAREKAVRGLFAMRYEPAAPPGP